MRPEIELPPGPEHALKIKHDVTSGWEQWYLIISDCHWDSPECYLKLLHRHLKEARERKALVIDLGDMFDAISGRDDPRGSKGTVREEHCKINYLDALVNSAVDEFRSYADLYAYCGTGNHEMGILVRKETDLMARFLERLNPLRSSDLPPIHRAAYTGWIKFCFTIGTERVSHAMKCEHGTGGNSPVSKGVQMAPRRAARVEGATFIATGHIHERWQVETLTETLTPQGRIVERPLEHIQVGSYKRDYRTDGVGTWWMQKSGQTKPIGGKWLRFFSPNGSEVRWEVTSAWVPYSDLTSYLSNTSVVLDEAA